MWLQCKQVKIRSAPLRQQLCCNLSALPSRCWVHLLGALAAGIKPLRNQLLNVYFISKIFSKVGNITFKFYVILTL
jgi:hypothetical protein